MSQHFFVALGGKEVLMGYDLPLDYVFCMVHNKSGRILYSNLDDSKAGIRQQDVNYYREPLAKIGITVPEKIYREVQQDQADRVGNRLVRHNPEEKDADKSNEKKAGIIEKIKDAVQNRHLDKEPWQASPDPDKEIDKILSGLLKGKDRTNAPDERKERMDRMRKAVREAHEERKEIRSVLDHYLETSLSLDIRQDVNDAKNVLDAAADRNLLLTRNATNEFGQKIKVEMIGIKPEEKLNNRPAVRASREDRGKDSEIGRYRQALMDQVDKREIKHYFTVKEFGETTESGRAQVRQEAKERTAEMLLGNRSFLNNLKTDEGWKQVAAMYEEWRAAIRGMSGADIIQVRRQELNDRAAEKGNSVYNDRW